MTYKKQKEYAELMKTYYDFIPKETLQSINDLQKITEQPLLGSCFKELEKSAKLVTSMLKSSESYIANSYFNAPFEKVSEAMIIATNPNVKMIQEAFRINNSFIDNLNQITNSINTGFLNNSFLNMSTQLADLYQNQNSHPDTYSVDSLKQITTETTNLERQITTPNTIETISEKDRFISISYLYIFIKMILTFFTSSTTLLELQDTKLYLDIFSNNTINIINTLEIDNTDQSE